MKSVVYQIFKLILFLILPFIFLIRGAVFLHDHYQSAPWTAILGATIATAFLLIIYMTVFYGRITGTIGNGNSFKRRTFFSLALVIGYSVYGLFFMSNNNSIDVSNLSSGVYITQIQLGEKSYHQRIVIE